MTHTYGLAWVGDRRDDVAERDGDGTGLVVTALVGVDNAVGIAGREGVAVGGWVAVATAGFDVADGRAEGVGVRGAGVGVDVGAALVAVLVAVGTFVKVGDGGGNVGLGGTGFGVAVGAAGLGVLVATAVGFGVFVGND